MSEKAPKEVHGLITAAKLALHELINNLPAPIVGSHKDLARNQLGTALQAIEMVKYHVHMMENEVV